MISIDKAGRLLGSWIKARQAQSPAASHNLQENLMENARDATSAEFDQAFATLKRIFDDLSRENATLKAQLGAPNQAAAAASGGTDAAGNLFEFMGYQVPVDLMLMTGGGPANFAEISDFHMTNLQKWIGIQRDHNVVEIGCGIGRDAMPLTQVLTAGSYIGIDIIGRSIDWCRGNISPKNPNFSFYHFNVDDELHNPAGNTKTLDIRIPAEDGTIDRIFLFSVFTHLLRADIEHYLREFRRVLKPDGLVYATTFIYDDAILKSARETALTPFNLRFEHEVAPGCRINDPDHPLGAVAFSRAQWDEMVAASGMRYAKPLLRGAWSGFYQQADDGQDAVVLAKA